jgi:hypothetical protein
VKDGKYGGYILYSYENRRMKPVKIVLRRGRRSKGDNRGDESN